MKTRDIVLLSTADWDNPFWTNKQHVAVALAKMGYRVFYIDSLGLRKPSVSKQDFSRIVNRIKKAARAPYEVQPNIWLWSPIPLPFQRFGIIRQLNKLLLNYWLTIWLNILKINKTLLWTYNPLTTQILNINSFKKVVYHCVDEIKAQPGMPVDLLESGEFDLVSRSNYIFTTSIELFETREKINRNTYYFSNVSDFNHFQKALDESTSIPDDIIGIPKPILGFVGALSGYKVDFKLLEFVAKKNPHYSFVLIGKVGEGDPWTDISNLTKIKNIHLLGPKSYEDLPAYLKGIDVAILPNMINKYTDSMFPMKFFEYLAASKPVVSVNLKSLRDFSEVVFLSKDYNEFNKNINKALEDVNYNFDKRIDVASRYTYDSRMQKMMNIVEGKL